MTLIEILHEIEKSDLREDVLRALVDMTFKDNKSLSAKKCEYKASLKAINKINNGKNEAIDTLSQI